MKKMLLVFALLCHLKSFGQCHPSSGYGDSTFGTFFMLHSEMLVDNTLISSGWTDRASFGIVQARRGLHNSIWQNRTFSRYYNYQIWMDLNHNDTFEISETVGGANNLAPGAIADFYIPDSVADDTFRLRIVFCDTSDADYPSIPPCGHFHLCNAVDYKVFTGAPSLAIFQDRNSNCIFDWHEDSRLPVQIAIDSNGVHIDTISVISGTALKTGGPVGTVYTYNIFNLPAPLTIACPSTGVIRDTIGSSHNHFWNFGLSCTGMIPDLSVQGFTRSAIHRQRIFLVTNNFGCAADSFYTTVLFSPKYNFTPIVRPYPSAAVSGNSVTWNASLEANDTKIFVLTLERVGFITVGDTVQTRISVTSQSGTEINLANNMIVVPDTVRSSYDPNAIWVKPEGCLPSGDTSTQMKYVIAFENTGNDTAHHIYVVDTISKYLDYSSLTMEMASHAVYTYKMTDPFGNNIVTFDFPNINLLDSSHHGQCDGLFSYHINTLPGLGRGTNIYNRVGIYFDDNPVVMTNTVHTNIGCTLNVPEYSKAAGPVLAPNPSDNYFTVYGLLPGTTNHVVVKDLNGRVVRNYALVQAEQCSIDLSGAVPGIYLIEVINTSEVHVLKAVLR